MEVHIYFEGAKSRHVQGRDGNLKEGFRKFFDNLLGDSHFVTKLIPCTDTWTTVKLFCAGVKRDSIKNHGVFQILLIDSDVLGDNDPFKSVKSHDNWALSKKFKNDHIHFMKECMEAWFLADKQALTRYYGDKFNMKALPSTIDIELISKSEIMSGLYTATQKTSKGEYHKTKHAPGILKMLSPKSLTDKAAQCKRLFKTLEKLSKEP